MRTSQESSAFIKRADGRIFPVTVPIDNKGYIENTAVWKLVFGDNPPKTPEDKLEFLQGDPDIQRLNDSEDSLQLMCMGCSRPLLFDFPNHINIASWLRHKIRCEVVQKQYQAQYLEAAQHQIKQEDGDDEPLAPAPRAPLRAPTRKMLREEQRKRYLEQDPLISCVEEHRVWCKPCGRWIGGTAGLYSHVNWRQHRMARHEKDGQAHPQRNPPIAPRTKRTAAVVQQPERKVSQVQLDESKGPRFPTRQVTIQRKRLRADIDDEENCERSKTQKIIKREEMEGPGWLAKVANGLGKLWSTLIDSE